MDLSSLMSGGMQPGEDIVLPDTAETIRISPLALMKMLRHGRAGVPIEVMGLMLGSFVDEYTIEVVDVFAMPQTGTSVSVESIDPVFQMKMLDMLKQTGRPETVVGWYHSHPGFGCWLSSVDIDTQQSFETLNKRAVAVVVDPIQSVRGKVVIDAFRIIPPQLALSQQEPRQTTSLVGKINKPNIIALIHGLNRHYYSLNIDYTLTDAEEKYLLLGKHTEGWAETFKAEAAPKERKDASRGFVRAVQTYTRAVSEELHLTEAERRERYVGRRNPRHHLEAEADRIITENTLSLCSILAGKRMFEK
ncbi:MAG: 26S proteasome regulatory subunit N11, RPN11/PSMD14 [Amphiamblys sp. WSBS2006]|nr:MAG: 26S proteasome regulatory subunit N11, RPN11/PSMD14 [Amphiamblys sp. WSBS2006]